MQPTVAMSCELQVVTWVILSMTWNIYSTINLIIIWIDLQFHLYCVHWCPFFSYQDHKNDKNMPKILHLTSGHQVTSYPTLLFTFLPNNNATYVNVWFVLLVFVYNWMKIFFNYSWYGERIQCEWNELPLQVPPIETLDIYPVRLNWIESSKLHHLRLSIVVVVEFTVYTI